MTGNVSEPDRSNFLKESAPDRTDPQESGDGRLLPAASSPPSVLLRDIIERELSIESEGTCPCY